MPLSDLPPRWPIDAATTVAVIRRKLRKSHKKTIYTQNVFWYSEIALAIEESRAKLMEAAQQSSLTRDEMESRRLLAAQDLQRGLSQSQVARRFGVSRTTASRWNRALAGRGVEALRKRRAPGRPSRLTQEQFQGLAEVYRAGARAAGFDSDRWTTKRFAEAILGRFHVRYDPDHVGRLMHRLGLRERMRRRFQPAAPGVIRGAPYSPNTPSEVAANVA